jgi:hypothetical protein
VAEGSRKIGEGHAEAVARLGLAELRGAMYTGSNVAQHSEYGLYGTLTPGEVAEARRGDGREMEAGAANSESILGDRLRQAEDRDDRDDNSRDMDRE